jgi:hypothetical protein
MTTPSCQWAIPPRVWAILLSWGVAVFLLAGLFSWRVVAGERQASEDRTRIQAEQNQQAAAIKLEQDRAMCGIIGIFLSGPEPVPGPAGDRSRSVRKGMTEYRQALQCDLIGSRN